MNEYEFFKQILLNESGALVVNIIEITQSELDALNPKSSNRYEFFDNISLNVDGSLNVYQLVD